MKNDIYRLLPYIIGPICFIVGLWAIELFEQWTGIRLSRFGIFPRDWRNLTGIFTGPLIHGDWWHIINNSFSLLPLLILLKYFHKSSFYMIISLIWILTGTLVWLFAREGYHIGISGVIFGLISFLMFIGFFAMHTPSIFVGLLVLTVNSGFFMGFAPLEEVSWQSHFFGALSGVATAVLFKNSLSATSNTTEFSPIKTLFFEQNTFDLTKNERFYQNLLGEEQE